MCDVFILEDSKQEGGVSQYMQLISCGILFCVRSNSDSDK